MKFFFKQKQKIFKLPKQIVSKVTIEADMLNYRNKNLYTCLI